MFLKLILIIIYAVSIDYSFTELVHPYATITTIIALCLLNINYRIIYCYSVIILGFIASIYLPLQILYGTPNIGMIISLAYTTLDEAHEFITNIPIIYVLLAILLLSYSIFIATLKLNYATSIHTKRILLGFIVLMLISILLCIKFNKRFIFSPFLYFSENMYKTTASAYQEQKRIQQLTSKPDTWDDVDIKDNGYDTYILVIGESVRRDFIHALGFKINNTPFMDDSNGVLYQNYFSAGPNTPISLLHSLAAIGRDGPIVNNNIISLANKANIYSYWISNQGSLGLSDTPIAALGHYAKEHVFLRKGDFEFGHSKDSDMLPYIESALASNHAKKLIVVHLIGSHPDFCARTDGHFESFFMSKSVSCYVQSIKNTDLLLKKIVDLANTSKSKWRMIYMPDHGLRFISKNTPIATLAHSDQYVEDYNVPFFMTSYDAKKHVVNRKYYTGINFLSLFVNWTGVSIKSVNRNLCNPLMGSCSFDSMYAYDINDQEFNLRVLYND
ncbi:MAG: phosphoethanolamine transferase [Burkholderiales bacterium]|nr:phosphoethanolamine transferase [Burkholderiales bacterium]